MRDVWLFIAWPSFPPPVSRKNKLAVEGRMCGSLSSDPWEPGAGPHLKARRRRISYYTSVCLARCALFGAMPACAVAFHLKPLCISPNIWLHVCPTSGLENEQFACRWLPLNDSKDNIWKSFRTGGISRASLMYSLLNGTIGETSLWKTSWAVSLAQSCHLNIIVMVDTVACVITTTLF